MSISGIGVRSSNGIGRTRLAGFKIGSTRLDCGEIGLESMHEKTPFYSLLSFSGFRLLALPLTHFPRSIFLSRFHSHSPSRSLCRALYGSRELHPPSLLVILILLFILLVPYFISDPSRSSISPLPCLLSRHSLGGHREFRTTSSTNKPVYQLS